MARGARAAYNLAPSPATFLVLVRAAQAALSELETEWASLPSGVQTRYQQWASRAGQYRTRLGVEKAQARKLLDLVAADTLDWQSAVQAGSEYAQALNRFFQGGDSAYWAHLSNQLADILAAERPMPGWKKATWLASLWVPWTATSNIAIGEMIDSGSEKVSEMADATERAIAEKLPSAETFRKAAGALGILGIAIAAGAAAWFFAFKD